MYVCCGIAMAQQSARRPFAYFLCATVYCLQKNRKWKSVVMRLRVVYRLKCFMVTAIKLFYYMLIAAVRVCRALFIQMWYKNRIQTLYESVHSLSR